MNTADWIKEVAQKIGLTKGPATQMVEIVFCAISRELAEGDVVKIDQFGNFGCHERRRRWAAIRAPASRSGLTQSARRNCGRPRRC
jgi:nucleoid DNA-binding protein